MNPNNKPVLNSLSRSRPHPVTALVSLAALLLVTGCTQQLFVASSLHSTPVVPDRKATTSPVASPPVAETLDRLQVSPEALVQTEVHGPGIVLTLRDSTRVPRPGATTAPNTLIHDTDLQGVVNALYGAEAEAISINGQRLFDRSAIQGVGNAIQVNGCPLLPPYEIRAIGASGSLSDTLNRSWGPLLILRTYYPDMVTLEQKSDLIVPALHTTKVLRYARPTGTSSLQQKGDRPLAEQSPGERKVAEEQAALVRTEAEVQQQSADEKVLQATLQSETLRRLKVEQEKAQRQEVKQEMARRSEVEQERALQREHPTSATLQLLSHQQRITSRLSERSRLKTALDTATLQKGYQLETQHELEALKRDYDRDYKPNNEKVVLLKAQLAFIQRKIDNLAATEQTLQTKILTIDGEIATQKAALAK